MSTKKASGSGASLACAIAGTVGGFLPVLVYHSSVGVPSTGTALRLQSFSEVREVKHLAAGQRPGSVALADINADGAIDILVASMDEGTLTVWLGNGRGEFRTTRAGGTSLGPRPTDIVVADSNRDGHLDVACANHETDHLSVLLGDGTGGFTPARGSPVRVQSQPHPHGIAAGDFDGDGNVDLATESRDTSTIEIVHGNGDGTFRTPGWSVPIATGPYHKLRAADLDGDGKVEIVVPSQESDAVTIVEREGAGAGDTSPRWRTTRVSVPRSPFVLTARDVDGDGHEEIVIAHFSGNLTNTSVPDGVSLVQRSGAQGWRAGASLLGTIRGRGPVGITTGRFRRDLQGSEIAVANLGTRNVELLAFGAGRLQSLAPPIQVGEGPLDIAAGDLNADGIDEIVTADSGANSVSVIFLR